MYHHASKVIHNNQNANKYEQQNQGNVQTVEMIKARKFAPYKQGIAGPLSSFCLIHLIQMSRFDEFVNTIDMIKARNFLFISK